MEKKVSADFQESDINEILDSVFKDTNIRYKIVGRQIALFSEKNELLAGQGQQQKSVTGKVTDSSGAPLPGVTVVVKGTANGIITDADGNYSLANVPADATLVFSFVGMKSQEIPVGGKISINVKMEEETVGIEEVVAIGYGTQKKVNLSGAVFAVKGDILENRPITNLGQGLQGVIPSLQITQGSYAPGQGAIFNIRGYTSLNGGSPLILVDGVVEDPNLLNPDDVESVSVLKDAASSAIYGARAAYGVMLITTKKGKKEQRPTLNVSSSYTATTATNIPEYANSMQYITYMNTASVNAGGSNYFDQRLIDNATKYYNDPTNNLPVYYDPAIDTDGKYKYCGNTNWTKELYKSGALKQINTNLSGGTEKTRYYISYGYMDQGGFLMSYDDQYQRHNINVFLDTDVLKWLSVSTRAKYTYSYEDHPSGGSNGKSGITEYSGELKDDLRPLMPVKHPDGNFAGQGSFTNPLAVGAQGGHDQRKVNDIWLTGNIDIHPIKDLNLKADFTFNPYSWNKERTSQLFYEYWAMPGKSNIYPHSNPNSVALENKNNYYRAINVYMDYSKSFGKNNFKLLVGYNQEEKNEKWYYAKRENLIDNDLPAINRAIGEDYVDGSITSWATEGIFTRFNYDYAGKYLLEVNGRYDGSSKFPKNDRYAFFPSLSGAWRISEESFWLSLKPIVADAKLRGSYGSLGNQNVSGNFPYISNYSINSSTGYMLGGILPVSVASGALVSPSFTWEKVNQWNFGADLSFLKNQLNTSIDVYSRNTIGMLTTGQPLPAVLGTNVPSENAANLKTYGWESVITWRDKIKDLSYNITFNISDAQSEITKFDNPTGDLSSYYVGKKIGEIWGYEAKGLFQTQEEIDNHASQTKLYAGTWNPGDVKYVDLNNDKEISWGKNTLTDHGDQRVIGNNTPRYQYGLQANALWKGFDINIFFQGTAKCDMWTGDKRFFGISKKYDVPMKATLDYWTEDNKGAYLPRPYINGGHGNWQVSTHYLQNGAYVRLKQITLGYTLPEMWSKKAAMSKARIYFTGQNLLTLTKLNELYDPENTNLMAYPVPKSYSFGINLTF
ncbi:MAG TPA: SusC/RagA family TonB-linked outer membrane protein [Prolixibacteraceae bacterium]|nr:SusC/RagA family TonB-linked outer membrane protein [Marinilabiliales bacterium]HBL74996.1 SusC/RagA family TonB-linked outer membrane protein [Prolixibacteraceae bacterium]HCU60331.1 SusC/RagA family TonB-linked outer membrane protein [Prolixibacteraceae bacterium]